MRGTTARDLLDQLAARPLGARLADLYDGPVPVKAADAAARLVEAGLCTRSGCGLFALTDAGRRVQAGERLPGFRGGVREPASAGARANSRAAGGRRVYRARRG